MIELCLCLCLVSCFCVDYFFFGFRTRESSLHTNCLLSEKNFGVIFKNFTVTVSLVSNRKQKKHTISTLTHLPIRFAALSFLLLQQLMLALLLRCSRLPNGSYR